MDDEKFTVCAFNGIRISAAAGIKQQFVLPGFAVVGGNRCRKVVAVTRIPVVEQQNIAGTQPFDEKSAGRVGNIGQHAVAPGFSTVGRAGFNQKSDTLGWACQQPERAVSGFNHHCFIKCEIAAVFFSGDAAIPGFALIVRFAVTVIIVHPVISAEYPAAVFQDRRLGAQESGGYETRFAPLQFFSIRIIADYRPNRKMPRVFVVEIVVALSPEIPESASGIEPELNIKGLDFFIGERIYDQQRFSVPSDAAIGTFDHQTVIEQTFAGTAGVPAGIERAFRSAQNGGAALPLPFAGMIFFSG